MASSLDLRRRRSNRGFELVVVASILLHAGIILWLTLASDAKPKERRIVHAIPVELVKLGKKRDPQLLPRKVEEPPPAPSNDVVNLDTKPTTETAPPSKPPQKLSDAARRMLDRSTSDTERENPLDRAMKRIEDPEGDPEGHREGTTTDASRAARGYEADVSKALKSSYTVPELIPTAERRFLEATVTLYIGRDGRVLRYEFIRTHPNKLFTSALEKMFKTIQLPPPPAKDAVHYRDTGLDVVFKP